MSSTLMGASRASWSEREVGVVREEEVEVEAVGIVGGGRSSSSQSVKGPYSSGESCGGIDIRRL